MDNTENVDLATITANMTAAEVEQYYKTQLTSETKLEPAQPKEEEPQKKQEVVTEEEDPVLEKPKDKSKQKEKILKSQARMWKETAEKERAEKEELLRKISAWEVENDLDTQEKLLNKIVAEQLAKMQHGNSVETEKMDFIKKHSNEIDLLPQIEEIVRENPTLSLEQARVLYLADNKPEVFFDPIEENRKKLVKQSAPGMSISSEEKSFDSLSSDEIAKAGKQLLWSGKLTNTF